MAEWEKDESPSGLSRRQFMSLSALGLAATASRTVAATRRTSAASEPTGTLSNGRPYAKVRTAEFFGDEEMTLTFPRGWQVQMAAMTGHSAPELTDDQIRQALRTTIGTQRIAEIADRKRTVVITFDDLARPTPTGRVVPFVLEELHAAGIKDSDIIFQGSYGTHSAMYQQDMVAKLGRDIVERYQVWNHDCHNACVPVGTTTRGNDVRLNPRFMQQDLKITISGIKPHGMAGYGGGAKAILPGVAWIKTVSYIHNEINSRARATVAYVNNEVRLDMEEAARLAGLDVSVNLLMNGDRKVCGLYAGDVVEAHRAACRAGHPHYETQIPQNMDVAISNAYPQSVEAGKEFKYCGLAIRDGGTAVLIQDTPAGQRKIHYLGWSESDMRLRPRPNRGLPVRQAGQCIVFNRWPCKWDEMNYSEEVKFASTWEQVVELLRARHGDGTKVAVFPSASLQHEPMELRI